MYICWSCCPFHILYLLIIHFFYKHITNLSSWYCTSVDPGCLRWSMQSVEPQGRPAAAFYTVNNADKYYISSPQNNSWEYVDQSLQPTLFTFWDSINHIITALTIILWHQPYNHIQPYNNILLASTIQPYSNGIKHLIISFCLNHITIFLWHQPNITITFCYQPYNQNLVASTIQSYSSGINHTTKSFWHQPYNQI